MVATQRNRSPISMIQDDSERFFAIRSNSFAEEHHSKKSQSPKSARSTSPQKTAIECSRELHFSNNKNNNSNMHFRRYYFHLGTIALLVVWAFTSLSSQLPASRRTSDESGTLFFNLPSTVLVNPDAASTTTQVVLATVNISSSPPSNTKQHDDDNNNKKSTASADDELLLVDYGDSIYTTGDWDAAPVILEKYKLAFFTSAKVGCTVWKQLFRRIMGQKDWLVVNGGSLLPWNPELNGLKYLYHYDRTTANHIMTSPEWTRALIVREPKVRFVSAYLDKAFHPDYLQKACCAYTAKCVAAARNSTQGFLKLIQICDNAHWAPQSRRMEAKFWPYINFIGHMETIQADAERLLRAVGAWQTYGATGWGANGNMAIFQTEPGGRGREHATGASKKLRQYISPQLEVQLDDFYRSDYNNPYLNITKLQLYNNSSSTTIS